MFLSIKWKFCEVNLNLEIFEIFIEFWLPGIGIKFKLGEFKFNFIFPKNYGKLYFLVSFKLMKKTLRFKRTLINYD